jgi:acyl-CoA synthetase (AMP-forming)/AMP-acid ligase II
VGILSQSRPEWVRADFAILSIGGVTIPVYPTYPSESLAYIARDSGMRTLFVEDQHQLEKALAVAAEVPSLESVIVMQGHAGAAGADRGLQVIDWETPVDWARPPICAGRRAARGEARRRGDDRLHLRHRGPRRGASCKRTGTI